MRLTKKQNNKSYPYIYSDIDDSFQGTPINKLGRYEDIDEKLGFTYPELIEMLENGIWQVGAVFSDTMKPAPEHVIHWFVFGIDTEHKILNIVRRLDRYEMTVERTSDVMISIAYLDKFNKKELNGWALKKEDLVDEHL